jgi:hypothetical protein
VGAIRAKDFPRRVNKYGQAGGDHASSRTGLDGPEQQTGIYGLEGRARRVPDEMVDPGLPWPLPDNTAGIAIWLDARKPRHRGNLTRKRSLEADGRRSTSPGRRAITGPLATVSRSHSRLLRSSRVSSSAGVTAVRYTPSKLVMRVRFPSPAPPTCTLSASADDPARPTWSRRKRAAASPRRWCRQGASALQ